MRTVLFLSLAVMAWLMLVSMPAQAAQARLSVQLRDHAAIVLLIDPTDGAILDANQRAARFYGYDLEQLRQMHIQDINMFDADEVAREMERARTEHRNYFIFPHRLANGEVQTVEVFSSPYPLPDGRQLLLSIIHVVENASLSEEQDLEYRERLENLVAMRTKEAVEAHTRVTWIVFSALAVFLGLLFWVYRKHRNARHFRRRLELEKERNQALDDLLRTENLLQVRNRIAEIFFWSSDNAMYSEILDVLLESTQSQYGVFAYIDERGDIVAPSMSRDVWSECQVSNKTIHFPRETWGNAIWARAVREGKTLFKNEPATIPPGHVPIHNVMVVPILFHDAVIGHFELANREGGYSASQQAFVEELCMHIAPMLWTRLERDRLDAQKKKATDSLQASHLEMSQLVEAIPSILVSLDANFRVERWNNEAERVFKLKADSVMGQSLRDCTLGWDWARVVPALEECCSTGQPVRLDDLPFVQSDGVPGFLGLTISPVFSQDSRLAGLLLLGRDVTKMRLMESQLLQAQKLESIGQLSAGIAHEINTPIQFVNSNLSFLQESCMSIKSMLLRFDALLEAGRSEPALAAAIQEVEGFKAEIDLDFLVDELEFSLVEIQSGVERVTGIVHSMRLLSHPGRQDKIAVDINKTVESVMIVTRHEWKNEIDIQTDLQENLPRVFCMAAEISQALLNILVNALQAINEEIRSGRKKHGRIVISTRQDGPWVEIRVADNGGGIEACHQPRLFDPFFTTKEVGKGTGQGLSIAYATIVGKHQGNITFDTEMGKGTTFIVRLPISESDQITESTL